MDYEWKMNVNPLDYTAADTAEVLELGTNIWYYNYGTYDGYVSVVGDGVSTLDELDKLYARNDEIDANTSGLADAVTDIATNTSGLADAVADIATNTSGLSDAVTDIATIQSTYGLGVDQTWHDKTGVRVIDTTYTNTNAKPIQVNVNTSTSVLASTLYVEGLAIAVIDTQDTLGARGCLCAIVPAGSTYMFNSGGSSFTSWFELY